MLVVTFHSNGCSQNLNCYVILVSLNRTDMFTDKLVSFRNQLSAMR